MSKRRLERLASFQGPVQLKNSIWSYMLDKTTFSDVNQLQPHYADQGEMSPIELSDIVLQSLLTDHLSLDPQSHRNSEMINRRANLRVATILEDGI